MHTLLPHCTHTHTHNIHDTCSWCTCFCRDFVHSENFLRFRFFFWVFLVVSPGTRTRLLAEFRVPDGALGGHWLSDRHQFRALYTLLKSDVTRPWSCVRCHGCWLTHSQFHSQFHSRRHSLRITLKYTTLVPMRSSYVWTMKPWHRSEWRLGLRQRIDCIVLGAKYLCPNGK